MSVIDDYPAARAEFEEHASKIRRYRDTLALLGSALEAAPKDARSRLPEHWHSREELEQLLIDASVSWEKMRRLWKRIPERQRKDAPTPVSTFREVGD
jgi:hypothetical protein